MDFFNINCLFKKLFAGAQASININMINMNSLEKGLYIISTPIGNLEDISIRAKKILSLVDFIICENPLHSLKLLNNLGIKKKLLSLHDYNEKALIKKIEKYQDNSSIALISDAGSPLISDPGYNLVLNYIEKKLFITTVPGASSVISALQLSGMPIHNYKFFGFVSKNKSSINSTIKEVKGLDITSVFFISGKKLINFIQSLIDQNVDREISICKELTKKNEKVFRGKIPEVLENISQDINNLRGEFVILINGMDKRDNKTLDVTIETQIKKLLVKYSLTEVVEIVHKLSSISKKEIYKTALIFKNE